MDNSIREHQLENGLKILLKEIHTAPIVSHWVWYRVGSRYETPGLTGISHWVEHMQFKGTPSFPAGVLDKAISRDGGSVERFHPPGLDHFLRNHARGQGCLVH